MFTDEDAGDILDPLNGFDLKVEIAPSAKKVDGRSFMDTAVKARPKSTPLSDDPEQAKKWLESVPNIDDMYRQKTEKEIEQILNTWLAGGASGDEQGSSDEGSQRGGDSKSKGDALDDLVNEVKSEVKASAPKAEEPKAEAKGKRGKKAADVDLDEAAPAVKQDLDAAFADLMADEDNE